MNLLVLVGMFFYCLDMESLVLYVCNIYGEIIYGYLRKGVVAHGEKKENQIENDD